MPVEIPVEFLLASQRGRGRTAGQRAIVLALRAFAALVVVGVLVLAFVIMGRAAG